MIDNSGQTPTKRARVVFSSSDTDENDELSLSPTFDQTYRTLMNDEIVEICMNQYNSSEYLNGQDKLCEFMRKCDEIQVWIESVCSQRKKQPLCRSDLYLEKISHGKQMLHSSRFINIKMLGKVLVSAEPVLQDTVQSKISLMEDQWHMDRFFSPKTLPHVLDEINEDIRDLALWLKDIKQRLDFIVAPSNKETNADFVEFALKDFEVHNEVGVSIMRLIHELQDMSAVVRDMIYEIKTNMDIVETDLYQLWLKTLEHKMRLEQGLKQNEHGPESAHFLLVGQESGFESELSPMSGIRKMCQLKVGMKEISSGDCLSDGTTDLPAESDSAAILREKSTLSSSTLSSSTETMPQLCDKKDDVFHKDNLSSPRRIIRRRKRRSRRPESTGQDIVSTEESEDTAARDSSKSLLKRRLNEVSISRLTNVAIQSSKGLNYSEIADTAERLVRKTSALDEQSTYGSAKESDIEDIKTSSQTSTNDLDLDKIWDYYQAPMYSNEEGDSQILEVDTIKDWEPEVDTDYCDVIVLDDSATVKMVDKRLSMMTSGYETSPETNPTICSKSLICVLQFTTKQIHEMEKKMNEVQGYFDLGVLLSTSFHHSLNTLRDIESATHIHLNLIKQIFDLEPCTIAHNTTLMDNLRIMEKRWIDIKSKSILGQLNLIEGQMDLLKTYRNIDDLKTSMLALKEVTNTFYNVKRSLAGRLDTQDKVWTHVHVIDQGLTQMKVQKTREMEVILNDLQCVTESKCTRKLLGCELRVPSEEVATKGVNVQEMVDKFEICIFSLKSCMDTLDLISSSECRAHVSSIIEAEITLWQGFCDQVNQVTSSFDHVQEMEDLSPEYCLGDTQGDAPRRRPILLRHLPLHMAMVVAVAILGWWYNQSISDCRSSSSSSDWINFFYRFKDHLEPH